LKTVTRKEFNLLKGMLRGYYDHIVQNPETLIVRFLGLHCLSVKQKRIGSTSKSVTVQKVYFVVMANMFNTPFEIHRRYDLKGSWVGRATLTPPEKRDPCIALKDVDFREAGERIRVGSEAAGRLLAQVEIDCNFLRDHGIIDYSLLLGIHDRSGAKDGVLERSHVPEVLEDFVPSKHALRRTFSPDRAAWPLDAGVPLHQRDSGGLISSDGQHLYFCGVIDILTPYDSAKWLEHSVKGLFNDSRGVSCCEPGQYAERFVSFLRSVIE
jgi:1-phosphatidylinositol-4-phosphate 5-kinase